MLVAVAVDVLAVDVLEHEIGLAGRRDAGIDEVRDVRVGQAGEDGAFATEALLARAADERDVQQLDRRAPLETAVAAFGEPDAAHPAPPDRSHQAVRAEDLPRERLLQRRARDQRDVTFEEMRLANRVVLREQHLQVGRERRVAGPDEPEPGRTFLPRDVERLVQQRAQLPPAFRTEWRHDVASARSPASPIACRR